jgi:hypothetical protein
MTIRSVWIKPVFQGAALAAAAVTTMGGAGVALAAPATLAAKPAATSAVPLSKVGPGWSIAEYTTGYKNHPAKTTLYAVSPQGTKYAFYTWPAKFSGANAFSVVDWSGDKQRVLVSNFFNKFEQISVATGKVINTFKLPASVFPIGYTRPDGENILAQDNNSIVRYDLNGHLAKVLSKNASAAIDSPDGTAVYLNAKNGIKEISNLGTVIKTINTPVAEFGCTPVRWWNSSTVLGQCTEKHGPIDPRLWLFPVNGGKVTALTAQRGNSSHDLGDVNAYKLTSGTYLQALGPCSVEFIATQSSNGSVHQVSLPGVHYDSDVIVTGQGSSLLVKANSDCSPGTALLWFNPQTKKVTWVLHPTGKSNGVESAVPFGRPVS